MWEALLILLLLLPASLALLMICRHLSRSGGALYGGALSLLFVAAFLLALSGRGGAGSGPQLARSGGRANGSGALSQTITATAQTAKAATIGPKVVFVNPIRGTQPAALPPIGPLAADVTFKPAAVSAYNTMGPSSGTTAALAEGLESYLANEGTLGLASGSGFDVGVGEGVGSGFSGFFGIDDPGEHAVYVLDMSGSMTSKWKALLTELQSSLNGLAEGGEFGIVLYDTAPLWVTPTHRLVPRSAYDIAESLRKVPEDPRGGGTFAVDALRSAIQLHPDVIYFLTDADDAQLEVNKASQVETLTRENNARARIHCLQFNPGNDPKNTAITELANKNNGKLKIIPLP